MKKQAETPQCVDLQLGALLFQYELGTLSEADSESFEDHLFKCDACREEFLRGRTFLQNVSLHRSELAQMIEQAPEQPAVSVDDLHHQTGKMKLHRSIITDWRYWASLAAAAIIVIAVLRWEKPATQPHFVQQMPADTAQKVEPSPSQNDSGMVQQSERPAHDTIRNARHPQQSHAPNSGELRALAMVEPLAMADLASDNLNFRGGQDLSIRPEDSLAWSAAVLAYSEKRLKRADSLAATVSLGSPLHSRALLVRGNIQLRLAQEQGGRLDSALTFLLEAAQTNDAAIEARIQWDLANVYLIQGKLGEAHQSLESKPIQSDFAYRDRVATMLTRIDSLQLTKGHTPKQ